MNLHLSASVAIATGGTRDLVGRFAPAQQAAVQLCGGDARHDGALRPIVSPPASRMAVACRPRRGRARHRPPCESRRRRRARPASTVDQDDTASLRNGHPAELKSARDHLGHEARDAGSGRGRCAAPRGRGDRGRPPIRSVAEPVATARRARFRRTRGARVARSVEAPGGRGRGRPETRAPSRGTPKDRSALAMKPWNIAALRRPVRRRVARQLRDVVLERRTQEMLDPSGKAEPVGSSVFRYSSPRAESSARVPRTPGDPVKSGCHEARTPCTANPGTVGSEEVRMQPRAHSSARGRRRSSRPSRAAAPGERVDPRAHEDRVEARHASDSNYDGTRWTCPPAPCD